MSVFLQMRNWSASGETSEAIDRSNETLNVMLHLHSGTSCIDRQQQHSEAAASSGPLLTRPNVQHSSVHRQNTVCIWFRLDKQQLLSVSCAACRADHAQSLPCRIVLVLP